MCRYARIHSIAHTMQLARQTHRDKRGRFISIRLCESTLSWIIDGCFTMNPNMMSKTRVRAEGKTFLIAQDSGFGVRARHSSRLWVKLPSRGSQWVCLSEDVDELAGAGVVAGLVGVLQLAGVEISGRACSWRIGVQHLGLRAPSQSSGRHNNHRADKSLGTVRTRSGPQPECVTVRTSRMECIFLSLLSFVLRHPSLHVQRCADFKKYRVPYGSCSEISHGESMESQLDLVNYVHKNAQSRWGDDQNWASDCTALLSWWQNTWEQAVNSVECKDARAAVLCGFSANSRYGKARQKIRKTGP